MFNDKLQMQELVVVMIFFIFLGALLASALIGNLILFIFGKMNKTLLTGEEMFEKVREQRNYSFITIKKKRINWYSPLFTFNKRTNTVTMARGDLEHGNLNSAFNILLTADNMEEVKTRAFDSRWKLIGIAILGLITAVLFTGVVAIIATVPVQSNTDKIHWMWGTFLQILAIGGWVCTIIVIIAWYTTIQGKKNDMSEQAKDILSKTELKKFNKMLNVWVYMPLSSRI
ncbi:hypothetical protein [[Acholeplasma] multilocale]|uniref:hypothetical protein n=1 Tax=[Acholeplasma] multilocale TaxID=264638 RepID=UPI000478FB0F|nr:hypothetical protein [[Acholeplasma] multilocale]